MKRAKIIIYSLAAVSAISVIAGLTYRNSKQYESVQPKVGPIEEAIYGIGTVESKNKFSFKLATPKTIAEVYTEEGSPVKQNQILLKFDDGTVVKSPLNGVLKNFPYNKGENAFTDRPVVEVEDQKDLFLEVALDQESSLRVLKGQSARISFETLEGKLLKGAVKALYHSNKGFIAKVEVESLPPKVLPGMTADVAIEVAEKESATLIPVRAIQSGQVLIERDGKRQKISITLGIMDKDWVEVTSGNINESDLILLKK